jgi:hypothetical protein
MVAKRYWAVNLNTGEGVYVYAKNLKSAVNKAAKQIWELGRLQEKDFQCCLHVELNSTWSPPDGR